MPWITFHHLVCWFETGICNLGDCKLFMVRLLGADNGRVRSQREVNTWVRHQVGLELRQIDVQSAVESEGGGDGGHYLTDQSVEISVSWPLDVQVSSADVIDGLIVYHEGAVGVLQGGVGGQDGVVRLHYGCGHLRGWVDSEFKLGFLSIVDRKTFHQQGGESGSGSTTEAVEDQESLQSGAIISQLPDSVEHCIDQLFPDSVVATSVVVRGILLSGDQLFRVEQTAVGAHSDLVYNSRFEVDEHSTWHVFPSSSVTEERTEAVIT